MVGMVRRRFFYNVYQDCLTNDIKPSPRERHELKGEEHFKGLEAP